MTYKRKSRKELIKEAEDTLFIRDCYYNGDKKAEKAFLKILAINKHLCYLKDRISYDGIFGWWIPERIEEEEKEKDQIIKDFDVNKARAKIYLSKNLKKRKRKE